MENQVTKPKFPTEMVDLPSKGLLYPEGSPLRSGQIEMKMLIIWIVLVVIKK